MQSGARFCANCGAAAEHNNEPVTSPSASADPLHNTCTWPKIAGHDASRIGAAAFVLLAILALWFIGDIFWVLALSPLLIGALFPLVRHHGATTRTENCYHYFEQAHARAINATGRFPRYFKRPLFASALTIWRRSLLIPDPELRAGLRVAALGYLATLMFGALLVIGYVLVAIIAVIAVILLFLWLLGKMLSGEEPSPTHVSSFFERVRRSERDQDLLGSERTVFRDENGRKIAVAETRENLFGEKRQVIYDNEHKKIAEVECQRGIFGDERGAITDAEGHKAGEIVVKERILGGDYAVIKDAKGKKVAQAEQREGILGDEYTKYKK